jgi:hypothetical protein
LGIAAFLLDLFRRDASRAGNHLGLGQQIEGLANIEEQHVAVSRS